MPLELRRIMLFTPRLAELLDFYRDVVGLEVTGREGGWVDFAAGVCSLAVRAGPSKVAAPRPT